MPRRPDARAALDREARGRDAVYGGAPEPSPMPASAAQANGARATWESRHHRVTFHCPLDLLDELEAEVASSGRKKNAVIVEALREHLHGRQRQR